MMMSPGLRQLKGKVWGGPTVLGCGGWGAASEQHEGLMSHSSSNKDYK